MELMEINFKEMETVVKKCIYFSKAQTNKVVKRNKQLYPLSSISGFEAFKNLYFEVGYNEYNNTDVTYINLYEDLGNICYNASGLSKWAEVDKLASDISNYKYFGIDGLINRLHDTCDAGQFINLLEIELLNMLGYNELAAKYTEYRTEYVNKKNAEYAAKEAERQAKEEAAEAERQKEIDNKLQEAEQNILNGKQVDNCDIEESTLILMLFKKYGINVSLKTQGWINKALANIHMGNDELWTYGYYSSSRNSTVFRDYLTQLIAAIKEANEQDTSAEETKLQKNKNKQLKLDTIQNLNFKKCNNVMQDSMDFNRLVRNGSKKTITEEEASVLYARMYKALGVENIEDRVESSMYWFTEDRNEYNRHMLTAKFKDREITVKAVMADDKIHYLFSKTYDKKKDMYTFQEIV